MIIKAKGNDISRRLAFCLKLNVLNQFWYTINKHHQNTLFINTVSIDDLMPVNSCNSYQILYDYWYCK